MIPYLAQIAQGRFDYLSNLGQHGVYMAIRYLCQIQGFSRNARLYLLAAFIRGVQFGIFRLIFNLDIVSRGYRQDFLGLLRALDPLVMLLASLPAGVLGDRIGHKRALGQGGGHRHHAGGYDTIPAGSGLCAGTAHRCRCAMGAGRADVGGRPPVLGFHDGAGKAPAAWHGLQPAQHGLDARRAAGQSLSGLVQVQWGFGPLFAASTALYLASAGLIFTFFARKEKSP